MTKKLLLKDQDKFLPEYTQEIPQNGIITVGGEISSTIVLSGDFIAPEQFVIVCEDARVMLLCRVGGTSVNGEDLPQGALHNLQPEDVIAVGDYTLLIKDAAEAEEILTNGGNTEQIEEVRAAAEKKPDLPVSVKNPPKKIQKGLKNVLEDLRTEEKFFFEIENAAGEESRIYIENEELWLVWTAEGECVPVFEQTEIAHARALIRKDWSGIILHPLQSKGVWINNKPLFDEPHRLKNGDRLSLLGKEGAKYCPKTIVKFHEPTALLVLDSILPKELPPPISLNKEKKFKESDNETIGANAENIGSDKIAASASATANKNLIFGHFTFAELIIMAVGTLFTAAVIFLILEFF